MNSIQKTARITGLLILLMAFIAPFSMIYVPSTLIVPGDATATAQQIIASEGLFRLSMASDAVVFLIEIGLCALLYVLLKPVSKTLSLVAAFARLAMTILQGINLLNHFMVLLLVGGSGYLAVFTTEQLQVLALLFLNAHETVVLIWGGCLCAASPDLWLFGLPVGLSAQSGGRTVDGSCALLFYPEFWHDAFPAI